MTDSEFKSAKLGEFVRGEIKENGNLLPHTGFVEPGTEASELMNFLQSVYDAADGPEALPDDFYESAAGKALLRPAATDRLGAAVSDLESYAVGLTDSEVELTHIEANMKIVKTLINNFAPYVGVMFGGMNTGKTGLSMTYMESWKEVAPLKYEHITDHEGNVKSGLEPVVVSNMDFAGADYVVNDFYSWRDMLLGDEDYFDTNGKKGDPPAIHPDRPVWWHFDECSTHLDARTNSYEVSSLYLPAVKRFAKVNIDGMHIAHSGMDVHADMRRATIITEFIFKLSKITAEVYNTMVEDAGNDLKYVMSPIPKPSVEYDPDDYSPWSWE